MSIRVAVHHRTHYAYDRLVSLSPQVIRLRPAPHCRTPIEGYSLRPVPEEHFLNWVQDPFGNFLARCVFPKTTDRLTVEVDLIADMRVINPFDFFIEEAAENMPFEYDPLLRDELRPYLEIRERGGRMLDWLRTFDASPRRTIDFLVDLNRKVNGDIGYTIRMEPGVQTCEESLTLRSGSCRDSAWLLVQALRHHGLAARFCSGYIVQLVPDVKSLDGPSGSATDFVDLHAWAEVFVPGAGWIGLDPTSGLLAGEGHIPLACTPDPSGAAPITGAVSECECEFAVEMTVTRIDEQPRSTKPMTDEAWHKIESLGRKIDVDLRKHDVRLTMGGEPTFVSIDDMDGDEWNTAAMGPNKRRLARDLVDRLYDRWAPKGLLHVAQGKWYPGEPLPRWALTAYWRKDGHPIWLDRSLVADDRKPGTKTVADAEKFVNLLARKLRLDPDHIEPGYEDVFYYLWKERNYPANVDPLKADLKDSLERKRVMALLDKGLDKISGFALPLRKQEGFGGDWVSCKWLLRTGRMYLVPGDSPMGLRLPLDALLYEKPEDRYQESVPDPLTRRAPLGPRMTAAMRRTVAAEASEYPLGQGRDFAANGHLDSAAAELAGTELAGTELAGTELAGAELAGAELLAAEGTRALAGDTAGRDLRHGGEAALAAAVPGESYVRRQEVAGRRAAPAAGGLLSEQPGSATGKEAGPAYLGPNALHPWGLVRTAICVEPRDGHIHVFFPPLSYLEDYLELVATVEETAAELRMPVVVEGYAPPEDPRLRHVKVTPDPGVIEVNLPPAESWDELQMMTEVLYHEARLSRLGTEKFMLDGRHTGTGGGNHVTLGGATPADSPLLRRPDLLQSMVTYWQHHPSLTYFFSGMFVGPTSQAPRVDEARHESLYELEIAFSQMESASHRLPWLVDRHLRNLLIDLTGNTHRTEFCIDKLFSPDGPAGRLGIVELRSLEMPPHSRMSLVQMVLLRALVARFWKHPYRKPLVRWGTLLHDKFMLPHFLWEDLREVIEDLGEHGYDLDLEWFRAGYEFRFPFMGKIHIRDLTLELRTAIEPWNTMGEETAAGGTARYVDSSLERLQVKVFGMTDPRHVVVCRGRRVPLHSTGTQGEYVAGVRYRAWQPPSALHPTIGIHTPLVFDVVDTWNRRSVGGCTYHVCHPGGMAYSTFPVNSYEAESRRISRFWPYGHTPGKLDPPAEELNKEYPYTLDLRRPAD